MTSTIRIAILDLYDGEANEGMRCIKELVGQFAKTSRLEVSFDVFDVRGAGAVPGFDFDGYISSGGPGSPLTSEGSEWENRYFNLMKGILAHNKVSDQKKFVFLICHSFQVFCRYFGVAKVSKRKSTSFGVMPVHNTQAGKHERLLQALSDPFWVIDSRDYQITQPNLRAIRNMGGQLLCLEKERPLIPLERAVMAIRFSNEVIGTQFHPEADYNSMFMYLMRPDKKQYVIGKYGERKYNEMLLHLNNPENLKRTYHTIIPGFLAEVESQKLAMLSPVLA